MMTAMRKPTSIKSAIPNVGIYELVKSGREPYEVAGLLYSKSPRRRNARESPKRNCDLNSIINRATEVMGEREKAILWLESPIGHLCLDTPISLLATRQGAEYVNEVLGQMERSNCEAITRSSMPG